MGFVQVENLLFSQLKVHNLYFSANFIEGIASKQTHRRIERTYNGSNGLLNTLYTLEGGGP